MVGNYVNISADIIKIIKYYRLIRSIRYASLWVAGVLHWWCDTYLYKYAVWNYWEVLGPMLL